jgi:hypothetical protein
MSPQTKCNNTNYTAQLDVPTPKRGFSNAPLSDAPLSPTAVDYSTEELQAIERFRDLKEYYKAELDAPTPENSKPSL